MVIDDEVIVNTTHRCHTHKCDAQGTLITYVTDRAGHDLRYAIDPAKTIKEFNWQPTIMFDDGIKQTIQWYLDNKEWWENIINGEYQTYYDEMYKER